jgi:hypothetical protein
MRQPFAGRARALGLLVTSAAFVLGSVNACNVPASDNRVVEVAPDSATFAPVSALLEHRCGSLDCHGQVGRNLRLYGYEGLRLAQDGDASRPSSQANTTDAEVNENYLSVVGLEPELMSQVVREGASNPLRLTLMRKPLGIENHKGGTLFQAGDSQVACVTSWLAGHTDTATCVAATTNNP